MKYSNEHAKFILVLLIFFFTFPFFLISEENAVEEAQANVFTEDSPIDIAGESGNVDSKASPLLNDFTLKNETDTVSYTSHIVRLVLSLVFVVFLAYVVVRFMKKSKLFVVNDDAYLKLVAQLNIEQGKSIKVFTLGEKAYIIGVTSGSITRIAEIEDKVLIDAMNLKANEAPSKEASSFSSVFANFFPAIKSTKTTEEVFNDGFLEKQQERIKNMKLDNE